MVWPKGVVRREWEDLGGGGRIMCKWGKYCQRLVAKNVSRLDERKTMWESKWRGSWGINFARSAWKLHQKDTSGHYRAMQRHSEVAFLFCDGRRKFVKEWNRDGVWKNAQNEVTVDHLCGLVVGVPGYKSGMYCVSCEVRTEFICYVEESRAPLWSSGQSYWLHNGDVLCFLWGTNWIYICYVEESRPLQWSSGQSSWLKIQRFEFDSRRYHIFLRTSGSRTGSTQPRGYNWGTTWKKK
jgi:hypothetical protein